MQSNGNLPWIIHCMAAISGIFALLTVVNVHAAERQGGNIAPNWSQVASNDDEDCVVNPPQSPKRDLALAMSLPNLPVTGALQTPPKSGISRISDHSPSGSVDSFGRSDTTIASNFGDSKGKLRVKLPTIPAEPSMTDAPEAASPSTWEIAVGDKTLNTALARWAAIAGWQLSWELSIDYSVEAHTSVPGSFEDAVEAVVKSMQTAEIPMKAIFYKGNKVLRIVPRGVK